MSHSQSRSTGILRLKGLREQVEAKGEDMEREAERFDALRKGGVVAVSAFNLFQTPVAVADKMAEKLGDCTYMQCLEPSAGLGRLYSAGCKQGGQWTIVEQSVDCCEQLYNQFKGVRLISEDFLACGPERIGKFDRILMNPPFKMGRDIKHIMHALSLLRKGGRIIGLCYNGIKQNKVLPQLCDSWEVLPDGSFSESGTKAGVCMFTISR